MNRPQRILIVNPFGIGDVLFSTPLVRALRRAFPNAYVAYLCNRRTEEILRRNPNLNELFIYEKDELLNAWRRSRRLGARALLSLLRQIRSRHFDLAIDLSLGERYSFLLAGLGVSRRIGFDFRHRGRFLTHRFAIEGYEHQHVVDYYRWLLEMIGVRTLDRRLQLETSQVGRLGATHYLAQLHLRAGQWVVGLVPAGGISWGLEAHFRRWSKEGFVHVGRALSQRHEAVLLVFGESQDHAICAEIAHAIGRSAIDLSGQTSLEQFVSLVACCDLVIANDGGPIHIAASQGIQTVSIFGPVDPNVYGPYPRMSQHRVIFKSNLPCRPCYHQFKLPPCPYERACLTDVAPSEVLEACEEALSQRREEEARVPTTHTTS